MPADKELSPEEKAAAAERNFLSGCNCCQSVLLAFADELGQDADTLMRLGSPFGGGIGRLRETCGTVTGMLMVYGWLRGYTDHADKPAHYERVRALVKEFTEKNGSIVCRELLAGVKTTKGIVTEALRKE
jgi:C_GCAxxG_C_C family probable redox protein